MPPFPFFRLPRELRDRIYEEVGGEDARFNIDVRQTAHQDDGRVEERSCFIMAEATSLPSSSCLVVSRTFKHEYETEIQRHTMLRVVAPIGFYEPTLPVATLNRSTSVHRRLRQITKLEIRLWMKGYSYEDARYKEIISLVCPFMSGLKEVTKDILVSSLELQANPDDENVEWLKAHLKPKQLSFSNRAGKYTIPLITRVYVVCRLVSMLHSREPTTDELERFPLLFRFGWASFSLSLLSSIQNRIIYQATAGDGEMRLGGLALTVFRIDHFDIEEEMQAIEDDLRDSSLGLLEA